MKATTNPTGLHSAFERVWIAGATTFVVVNVWTGAPLIAVWVGARVQGDGAQKMSTVFVVILTLAVVEFALGAALIWLSDRYDVITGRSPKQRRTSPWLRSMSGEREQLERGRITAVERIVVVMVAAAAVSFEVWFFFFAGSPI